MPTIIPIELGSVIPYKTQQPTRVNWSLRKILLGFWCLPETRLQGEPLPGMSRAFTPFIGVLSPHLLVYKALFRCESC